MTLNIRVQDLAPCQKRILIEIPAAEVLQQRQNIVEEYRQIAKIPGFRKGHAPVHIIEKRFAEAIEEETRTTLVRKAVTQALKQQHIHPVITPRVEDIQYIPGISMALTFTVEVAPTFSLPDYTHIPLPVADTTVTADEIEQFLQELRIRFATYSDAPADTPATPLHTAVIDFRAEIQGTPLEQVAPNARSLAAATDFWLPLDHSHTFLPGFAEKLLGHKPGDHLQIPVSFPDDFPHSELRGTTATYHTTLKALKNRILPELDDAFARQNGAESLQQLRDAIAQHLRSEKQRNLERQRRNTIAQYLLTHCHFDLPDTLVAAYTKQIIQNIVADNARRGVTQEQIAKHKDAIIDNATTTARDRLRLEFLLIKIAEKENISVSPTELQQHVAALAQLSQQPFPKLLKTLTHNGGIDRLETELLIEKTYHFLIQANLPQPHPSNN